MVVKILLEDYFSLSFLYVFVYGLFVNIVSVSQYLQFVWYIIVWLRVFFKNYLGFIGDLLVSDVMRILRSKDKFRVKLIFVQWKYYLLIIVVFRINFF